MVARLFDGVHLLLISDVGRTGHGDPVLLYITHVLMITPKMRRGLGYLKVGRGLRAPSSSTHPKHHFLLITSYIYCLFLMSGGRGTETPSYLNNSCLFLHHFSSSNNIDAFGQ